MAGETARAAVEAGRTAVMDFSLSVGALSISLKIDNVWIAGAVTLSAFALGAFYLTRPVPAENAIRRGLEGTDNSGVVDPEVRNITDGSILVELHCHTETSFLLFLEDFEKKTVKFRLEEEFKKIGFKDELDVTIRNAEEVYEKARQIREKSRALREGDETGISTPKEMASRLDDVTPHLNLREYWHETFDDIFQAFSPDEWTLAPTSSDMPKKWGRSKDDAKVKFLCDCGHSWTSMKGIIIFWYKKLDESERKEKAEKGKNNEGKKGEDSEGDTSSKNTKNQYSLRFRVYGQQCERCDDEEFKNARWYREEVEKVLKNVHQKIGEEFYHFPSQDTDDKKRHGRPRRPHDSKRCQACSEGHCSK